MTVEEAVQDGPKDVRPAKRRKVEQHDPFRPFSLVPSPQEARGLETSTPLQEAIVTVSGSLGDIDPGNPRS